MAMEKERFETWAVVELFGHHQIAGFVSEASIGGCNFVRVDVPEAGPERPAYTKFYGEKAIYAIHPCTEDLARQAVVRLRRWDNPLPVSVPDLTAAAETIRQAERLREQAGERPAALPAGYRSHADDRDWDIDGGEGDDDCPL